CFDIKFFDSVFEVVEVDTRSRYRRHLDDFQSQAFHHLEERVVCRTFYGHRIAGFGNGTKRKRYGFHTPCGDGDVAFLERSAPVKCLPRDLLLQQRVALCFVVVEAGGGRVVQWPHHGFFQLRCRQQGNGRYRQRKIDEVRGHQLFIHATDNVVHAYLDGVFRWRARLRYVRIAARGELNIVSRLWAGFDEAFAFEVVIRLKRRADTDSLLFAQRPYREEFIADFQDIVIDKGLNALGNFDVFVVGLFQGGHDKREIDMVKDREIRTVLNSKCLEPWRWRYPNDPQQSTGTSGCEVGGCVVA